MVRAMVVLGRKYQIDELYSAGYDKLLHKYVEREARFLYPGRSLTIEGEDLIEAATIVKALGFHDMHRAALYDCCQLDGSEIICGMTNPSLSKACRRLDQEDIARCIDARSRLVEAQFKICAAMFQSTLNAGSPTEGSACKSVKCRPLLSQFRLVPVQERFQSKTKHDPLRVHTRNTWFDSSCDKLCPSCKEWFEKQDVSMRQEVLDKLGDYV